MNIALVIFVSILAGSFMARFIKYYPLSLQQKARVECYQFLELTVPDDINESASHLKHWRMCGSCNKKISWLFHVPILGYWLMQGKCHHCKAKLSKSVFVVELMSMLSALVLYWQFGLSWQYWMLLVFTYGLLLMVGIDIFYHLLPDILTLTLLWVGLVLNSFNLFTSANNAILAAAFGYLLPFGITFLYKVIRKVDGMGQGDFKMYAVVGAWFGFPVLFNTILVSIFLGGIAGIFFLFKKLNSNYEFAFGPWIGLAACLSMLLGPFIFEVLR